jgi:transcriptional regulator with XRE-family HTH domain
MDVPTPYAGTTIPEVLERLDRHPAWLARRMGLSRAGLSRVLNGKRSITPEFVERACRALNLPESALFLRGDMRLRNQDREVEREPAIV